MWRNVLCIGFIPLLFPDGVLSEVYEWDLPLTANTKMDLVTSTIKHGCINTLNDHLNYTIHIAWEQFKHQFKRDYVEADEYNKRLNVFCENFLFIRKHNKALEEGKELYKLGINDFTDKTIEETQHVCGGDIVFPNSTEFVSTEQMISAEPPKTKDWRRYGAVTPVRPQGDCGCCWAFSAIAAIESHHFLKNKYLYTLSPQQLIDCSLYLGNRGCNGGNAQLAFMYVQRSGGIERETDYPYISDRTLRPNPSCRLDKKLVAVRVTGAKVIPRYNEKALTQAVGLKGPVTVMVNAAPRTFTSYKSGIYSDRNCGNQRSQLNHVMVAVGYGEENGIPYWIIKNSWGKTWGEDGYMRLRKDVNMCGVAITTSYPNM